MGFTCTLLRILKSGCYLELGLSQINKQFMLQQLSKQFVAFRRGKMLKFNLRVVLKEREPLRCGVAKTCFKFKTLKKFLLQLICQEIGPRGAFF